MNMAKLNLVATAAAMTLSFLLTMNTANAGVIYSENFSSGTDGTQILPGWTLAPSGTIDVLVLDSQDYRVGAGGINDTGTGQFLSFGAGNSPDDGTATTSTPVPIVSGNTYTLSFLYGSFSYDPNLIQSLAVLVNGSPIRMIATTGSTSDLSRLFSLYTITFLAPVGPGVLEFQDTSSYTDNVDELLDNVQISTTPLPSTWTMLIAGFAGLGFVACRGFKGEASAVAAA